MKINLNEFFLDFSGCLKGEFYGEFKSFKLDSREIKKGDIFIALKGSNFDGHDFVNQAVENGAIGVIVEKHVDLPLEIFQYIVPSTKGFLLALGQYARNKSEAKFIGITGSAGKTTTKEMVNLILKEKYNVAKTPGNLNTDLSLPIFLVDILKEKLDFVILEMGVQKKGDMDKLVEIAWPEISAILNIGESHTEFLKDREGVAKEKFKIVNKSELAILNLDNDLISMFGTNHNINKFFFGMDKRSDLSGEIINLAEDNMEVIVNYEGKKYRKTLPFSGSTFFYDMLAAVSVGINLGIDLDSSLNYVSRFIPLKGRGEIINLPKGIRIIDETYNSNPFSLEQSINRIKEHKDFLVMIIGDMLELGKNSQKLHEEAGEILASVKPDIVVGFGEYASFLKKGATLKGLKKVFDFNDRKMILNFLRSIAIPEKSIIFIKGSRGLKMEEFVEVFRERLYDGKN